MRRLLLLPLLPLVLASTACRDARPPPAARGRPNVLVVLVDTLRADHLSLYGYARPTSPRLDAFAEESVVFESANAQATCTFPSANSLLTSRHPSEFLGQEGQALGIPDGVPTLAAILRDAGYATHAVSASPIVRDEPSQFNPSGGFGAGFDRFDEACMWQPAACVHAAALRALDDLEGPFFLYLHYIDPHGPFGPPEGASREFAGDGDHFRPFVRRGDPRPIERMLYGDGPELHVTDAEIQHLIALYDDEIAYFDGYFGALVDELRARGLLDRTIVALVSDHGESFLRDGHIKHCRAAYRSQTWTPFVLRLPGGQPRGRRGELVANLDLVPTLLDLVGIAREPYVLAGRSLVAVIAQQGPARHYSYTSQGTLRVVRDERFELIVDVARGTERLYDVDVDPRQRRDIAAEHPDVVARLEAQLRRATSPEVGKATLQQLRALGYLE